MSKKNISTPKWIEFDLEWYCKRYSSILPIVDDIFGGDAFKYYQEKGRKIGHSPNPFFDEKWYLLNYSDVAKSVQENKFQSGFDHYCQEGYEDYSPHWLFNESYYQDEYKAQTNNFSGYKNGYDHYLSEGDLALHSGSLFFNPKLFLLQNNNESEFNKQGGPYQYFIKKAIYSKNKLITSWLFDEEWYLQTYPEVTALIGKQLYISGLHHYLSNVTPLAFSPLSDFSESFYDEKYTDLASAIGNGKLLRSGYHHFILYGFQEGRLPNETLDLEQFKLKEEVLQSVSGHLFINAFEYWVAQREPSLFKKFYDTYSSVSNAEVEQQPNHEITLPTTGEESVCEEATLTIQKEEAEHYDNVEILPSIAKDTPLVRQPVSLVSEVIDNNIETPEEVTAFTVEENLALQQVEPMEEKIEFVDYHNPDKLKIERADTAQVVLEEVEKIAIASSSKAIWKKFDEEWYTRKYSDVMAQMKALELDSVEEYYHSFGCHNGHSPNPYFDEEWYLDTYPNVKKLIESHQYVSGFDHYCQQGYLINSPHWLFSEDYYSRKNDTLTTKFFVSNGFANGYDHYLQVGDKQGLSCSDFFDPYFFIGRYEHPIQPDLGGYAHYLKNIDIIDKTVRTSWYFDPVWYLQEYNEVQILIKDDNFINPLHHYLTNDNPSQYSPLVWFDEGFYDSEYILLLEQEDKLKEYRNGYSHFINEGIALLWQPSPFINLGAYSHSQEVIQDMSKGQYPNIFVHWLANHAHLQSIKDLPQDSNESYTNISDIIEEKTNHQGAIWAEFDEEWYLSIYPDTSAKMEICGIDSVYVYYKQIGAYLGNSPNPYFDEEWYLYHHESVSKAIAKGIFKTGFEHYCHVGFKEYQPHWLFSPDYYLFHNPQFAYEINTSDDYVNVYDHYLKKGDALRKTGSVFFDPLVYERHCYESGAVEKTFFPYRNYLLNISRADLKASVSLYFDSRWYIERYPEVLEKVEAKEFTSALQHYFMNSTPTLFDPLSWFSEKFYVETYTDLAGTILEDGSGDFRNGYAHFIAHGAFECRDPCSDINLREYFLSGSIREDIENGFYRDAFAHWVFDKRLEAWINNLPEDSHYRLKSQTIESREYFSKKAQFLLPTVAHQKLDFSYTEKPDISVIMLVKNQLAVTLTALASLRANYRGKIQLLIGDNYSTDDTRFIQNSLIGVHIIRFAYNFGYGKACNYLLKQVQAPITVFLNNDIYLYPGAIDTLCRHLTSKADIGAVGGKIIHPDGNLQEAGSIIWRDGTTTGYLRGEDPSIAEANFVRDVDYCSTAMLAVKTILLQQLEGFSPIYYPAYFEDTDLCVRMIKAGYRVVYHPDAVVEHMEYASSDPIVSSGLIRRNHRKFVQTHTDFLRFQHPRHSDNITIARQREGNGKRILFIEDRVPLRRLGSGYVRSNDIVHQIAKLGYHVTVYPINGNYPYLYQIYSDMPETVEVLFDKTIDNIRDFFLERAGYYDVIWIGRTHNLHRILPMMGEANRYLPQDCLILDTEVIAAPRTLMRQKVLDLPVEQVETLEEALEIELSCARHCQTMITVNNIDANYAKQAGFDHVSILGHMMSVKATPKTWDERTGLLFVGALHDDLSPNYDSLQWFVSVVLPILVEKMGDKFTFTIAGYVHPSVDMSVFAKYSQVKLLGPVEDLTPLYNNHRVYIAPTRFAGGIPYKLHEAASFGIPIVAAELLVNQLGWDDDKDILAASTDKPELFASQIIRLYEKEKLWNKLRNNALSRIDTECSEQHFRDNLQQILTQVISHK